jgi:hypothetical protein
MNVRVPGYDGDVRTLRTSQVVVVAAVVHAHYHNAGSVGPTPSD